MDNNRMIKQYTRLVEDAGTGAIMHCTSQDSPFADGWEPITRRGVTQVNHDFELDIDEPDADFNNQLCALAISWTPSK